MKQEQSLDGVRPVRRGAVVLCGGRSTRMGRDKATLPFGPETLLQRVVRLVGRAVDDVVVVARPDQALPPLPEGVRVARDEVIDRGPLGGLAAGLAASRADAVYATACDVPFLEPAVVDLLFRRLGDASIAAPDAEGHLHPLPAVYRTSVRPDVERLLAEERLRTALLLDLVPTVRVPEAELRSVDRDLLTLANLNDPAAFVAALMRRKPLVRVVAGADDVVVDARSLGEALAEAALARPAVGPSVLRDGRLAPGWRASVNAGRSTDDPGVRLQDGDSVVLARAQTGG